MSAVIGNLIVRLALLFGGLVVVAGIGSITYLSFKTIEQNRDKMTTSKSVASPKVLPTATTQPSPKSVVKNYVKSNLIDCTGPDKVVFKTTQKECDEFNSAWGNKPTKQDSTSNNSSGNRSSNTYQPSQSGGSEEYKQVTCVTTTGTYYVLKVTCDQWQAEDAAKQEALDNQYQQYLEEAWQVYNAQNQTIQDCKDSVNTQYSQLNQNCTQYGGTSAYDACIEINNNDRDRALANCE